MTCTLKAIVAINTDRWDECPEQVWGIGAHGGLVAHNRADMDHFVRCTTGHAIIMGRKTLDSFPGGKPLANRRNIVLTRDADFQREGVEVVHSVEEALAAVQEGAPVEGAASTGAAANETMAWVIGGGEVYAQFLPYLGEAVVTVLNVCKPCDTFFPNLDAAPNWQLVNITKPADEPIEFRTYQRMS